MALVVAVDIGTESTRAALVSTEGEIRRLVARTHGVETPRPGWAQQDPELWWSAAAECISKVVGGSSPGEVEAVAVAGQMHGTVLVDARGQLVANYALLWSDKRSAEECEIFSEKDRDRLQRLAGNPLLPAWVAPKLRWLARHDPENYRRAARVIMPKDYVNLRLTGTIATDPSEASGTFLFDAAAGRWSEELAEAFEVDRGKLPDVMPSSAVIGRVTSEAASATGLPSGTPVVCGGGDMMCLLLGAGMTEPGVCVDVTGTAADVSALWPHPVIDPRLMNLHHVIGGWVVFGILDAGGGSLRWFRDTLCEPQADEASRRGLSPYSLLSEMAGGVEPGSDGLLFFPYLQGERTLGTPYSRGVFFGLTHRHTRAHMARAVMEGVAFDLRQSLDILRSLGVTPGDVRLVGGGARSPVWNQIKADTYKTPTVQLQEAETGILGAAVLAGLGVGVWETASDARAMFPRPLRRFEPDPGTVARYDALFELYQQLHDEFQRYFTRLHEITSGR